MAPVAKPRTLSLLMLVLTMIYGSVVAVMSVMDTEGLTLVATIGGCVVGIGWVLVSAANRSKATDD